jgi:predicted RNase H-like nuclease (RuvC/YqgF family)
LTDSALVAYDLLVGRTAGKPGSLATIKPQGVERLPHEMANAAETIERLARENERQRIEIEQLQREIEALKAELLKLQQEALNKTPGHKRPKR